MPVEFERRPWGKKISDAIIENPRLLILASMGSGKTAETLTALECLADFEDVFPALIVAPLRVANSVWPDELRKWNHLSRREIRVCTGSESQRSRALRGPLAEYYTINYESLDWLVRQLGIERWPFKTVIFDESTKIKGFRGYFRPLKGGGEALTCTTGKAGSALARVIHRTPRAIGLTGGFVPHSLADAWAQMWMIDGGRRLGRSFTAFQNRFLEPTDYRYDNEGVRHPAGFAPKPGAYEELLRLIGDVSCVVDPAEYLPIEKPIIRDISVAMPDKVRKIYDRVERDFYAEIEGKKFEAINAAAQSSKLLQIASGFLYDEAKRATDLHSVKIEALQECVEEAGGMPVLCSYYWNPASVDRLKKAFPKGRFLDKNPATVTAWNAGNIPVLFAHPASAGHGLNLGEGGNILVHFDLTWNAGNYSQINERVGPMRQLGRGRPAYRYHIVARDTLDDAVLDVVQGRLDFEAALHARLKQIQASA